MKPKPQTGFLNRLSRVVLLGVVFLASSLVAGAVENAGSLEPVPFAQLTDQTQSALGRTALAITPGEWKHAETEHFVYHYINSYVATPASVQAEFYYRVISKDLGKEQHPWERKSHIYLFEEDAAWAQFKTNAQLDPWTGGINAGDELFLQRDPSYRWEGPTLGHEITHLLLNRYYPGRRLPLWLNEGYAEYISKLMYVAFYRARGFDARPRSAALAPHQFLPLPQLFAMNRYPKEVTTVRSFYLQSEKLVWFLHSIDESGEAFAQLMDLTGGGTPFATAFSKAYGNRFPNIAQLETEFRDYATRHAADPEAAASPSKEDAEQGSDGWMIKR